MYGARGSRNTGEYGRMAPTQRRGSRVAVGKMEGSGLRLCVGCARTGGASAQKACMRGEVLRCQTAAATPRGPGGHDRTCKRCSSQTQWVSRSFALLPCKGLVGDEHRNCRCPPQRRAVTGTVQGPISFIVWLRNLELLFVVALIRFVPISGACIPHDRTRQNDHFDPGCKAPHSFAGDHSREHGGCTAHRCVSRATVSVSACER